jgi:uncharacterized protein (TIGR02588 family)
VGVVARNGGGHPAERVLVRGELRSGTMTETADTRISFIPAASWCWAGLHFRHDPRGARLTVRAIDLDREFLGPD